MKNYEGLIIESGDGNHLIDIDGKKYFDGVSSMWCIVHGHNHPYINAAIEAQLHKIAQVTLLGQASSNVVTLAKRLCDLAPQGLSHAFFASDGSSAIEAAMKLAFQYWRQQNVNSSDRSGVIDRNLFIAVSNAYHGDTIGALSVGGVPRFQSVFQPLLFPVLQGPSPACYSWDRNDTKMLHETLAHYDLLLTQNAGKVAAIIVEPLVQFAAGMVFHPQGFLQGLHKLARQHNTLLIADEIAVGFGKSGKLFACEHEGVTPDFLCLGKGLSGGYLPLSCVLTSDRIWDAFLGEYSDFNAFYHGHTFGGNPLAAAAAHATLDLFESEATLDRVQENSLFLADSLLKLAVHPNVMNPRCLGLIGAFDLVAVKGHRTKFDWRLRMGWRFCNALLEHGIWMRPLQDTIAIIPPLSSSRAELQHVIESIKSVLKSNIFDL